MILIQCLFQLTFLLRRPGFVELSRRLQVIVEHRREQKERYKDATDFIQLFIEAEVDDAGLLDGGLL